VGDLFPNPSNPPDYPATLDDIFEIQDTANDDNQIPPYEDDQIAQAIEWNRAITNLVDVVDDIRTGIIAGQLDPDTGDSLATLLARRSNFLTEAITGYDGDPNGGGAPAILVGANLGTWFREETAAKWWRKTETAWEDRTITGGGGGGFDFTEGKTTGSLNYTQDVVGAKASFASVMTLNNNPSDGEQVRIQTYFNDSGATAFGLVNVYFRTVLATPFFWSAVFGQGQLEIRIEANLQLTLDNMIAGLNDVATSDVGTTIGVFANTWTASHSAGLEDTLTVEQDFTGSFPNGNSAFIEISGSNWSPGSGVAYSGGIDDVTGSTFPITLSLFALEVSSAGPDLFLSSGSVKTGTHTPEVLVSVVGPAIIDEPNISFTDVVDFSGNTVRAIVIPATEDIVDGTATVTWTWAGKTFKAIVTKTVF